ncbi:hypothetical protein [Agarivorans gilvus]|uniref:Lipoprotein SmpA/OmlA domain-containing protein n=1 Tax=Agarivorans gilvus TaxID=680279 RepID=A0ABQ1I345_9ALTE|nr:hypothetical protein [Agarivorans gilvus]GGB05464.1 hypothetical protein GCM10007414_18510 [Agarivorans gilvus]
MNKKLIALSTVLMLSSLVGCKSTVDGVSKSLAYETGVEVSQEQMLQYVDGETTKQQLIADLGHPSRKQVINEVETWFYDYVYIPPFPGQRNISEASAFDFNPQGVLISHYKTQGKSGNPLIEAAKL